MSTNVPQQRTSGVKVKAQFALGLHRRWTRQSKYHVQNDQGCWSYTISVKRLDAESLRRASGSYRAAGLAASPVTIVLTLGPLDSIRNPARDRRRRYITNRIVGHIHGKGKGYW